MNTGSYLGAKYGIYIMPFLAIQFPIVDRESGICIQKF